MFVFHHETGIEFPNMYCNLYWSNLKISVQRIWKPIWQQFKSEKVEETFVCFIESHNHRTAEAERNLWDLLVQSPCSSSHLRPIIQDSSPGGFWVCRRMETTKDLWETCPGAVSSSPFTKYFLVLAWTLLCFRLWPLQYVRSLGTTDNSLALFSLQLPFRCLYTLTRSLSKLSLLQAEES